MDEVVSLTPCSVSGCPELVASGRCAAHRAGADRQRRPDGNPYGGPGHRAFRSQVLARDPFCVICRRARATVADHFPHSRRELIRLDLDPNDPEHGRGLCKRCHDRETATHQPGGWNA